MFNIYNKQKQKIAYLENLCLKACKDGDLESVKNILTMKKTLLPTNNNYPKLLQLGVSLINKLYNDEPLIDITHRHNILLEFACFYNHFEIVRYLLTSKELKYKADIHNNVTLYAACRSGSLEIVKYLIESSELREHAKYDESLEDENANINNRFLATSIHNHYIEMVKYLLSKNYINKKGIVVQSFYEACKSDNVEIVEFLLTDNKYKHYIDLSYSFIQYNIIKDICENNSQRVCNFLTHSNKITNNITINPHDGTLLLELLKQDKLEIVKYLIINYDMKKTDSIENFLEEKKEDKNSIEIKKLFSVKEQYNNLEENMKKKSIETKIPKKKL